MIDCHAHLAGEDFDANRDAVRRLALAAGVEAVLVVGEDAADNTRVLRVVAEAPAAGARLLPCLGFHPDRFADGRPLPTRAELDAAVTQDPRARGRDLGDRRGGARLLVREGPERRRAQAALLEEMAALSADLGMPLNVHSRSAGH